MEYVLADDHPALRGNNHPTNATERLHLHLHAPLQYAILRPRPRAPHSSRQNLWPHAHQSSHLPVQKFESMERTLVEHTVA